MTNFIFVISQPATYNLQLPNENVTLEVLQNAFTVLSLEDVADVCNLIKSQLGENEVKRIPRCKFQLTLSLWVSAFND